MDAVVVATARDRGYFRRVAVHAAVVARPPHLPAGAAAAGAVAVGAAACEKDQYRKNGFSEKY